MPDFLAIAQADLKKIEDRVAAMDSERNRAMKEAEDLRTAIRVYQDYTTGAVPLVGTLPRLKSAGGSATKSDLVSKIAEGLIRARGGRVKVPAILMAAEAAGVRIGGQTETAKRNYISGILSRSEQFGGIRHRGWWMPSLGPCPDDPPRKTEAADPSLAGASAASAEPRPTSEGTEPVRPVNPWPGGGT